VSIGLQIGLALRSGLEMWLGFKIGLGSGLGFGCGSCDSTVVNTVDADELCIPVCMLYQKGCRCGASVDERGLKIRPRVKSGCAHVATGNAVIKLQFISLTLPLTIFLTLTLHSSHCFEWNPRIFSPVDCTDALKGLYCQLKLNLAFRVPDS